MRNIGIWMDKRKAIILTIDEEHEQLTTIFSAVEEYHIVGGASTRKKVGPQDVVKNRIDIEREKHQLRAYFRNIVLLIQDADDIVIFGLTETKNKLFKELTLHYPDVSLKIRAVLKADSMTENQTKALIRNYFNNGKRMAV